MSDDAPSPASPIQIVSPEELDKLFATPPLELTDAQLEQMVIFYRSQRAKWVAEEASGATRTKRPRAGTPSAETMKAATANLSLDDLL
jgi:hypothetical protein